jgi:hypothetical protein
MALNGSASRFVALMAASDPKWTLEAQAFELPAL